MIGILQGRLTRPWNGRLQCFPQSWEAEFALARAAGFDAIEALVDAGLENPVWSDEGMAHLRETSRQSGVVVRVACADCFLETTFLNDAERALALLHKLAARPFELIVLPFFEAAELKSSGDLDRLAAALARAKVSRRRLALETTLEASVLAPFVDETGIGICYDLGNTTALGHDVGRDIRILGTRITHVHVKDKRKSDGANVLLGSGDTDFEAAASALREVGYDRDFTCETFRGEDPLETGRLHEQFVRNVLLRGA